MKTLINLMVIFTALMTIGFCNNECECEEPINVWFKISNDKNYNFGEMLKLDMSGGYASTDGMFIYLVVLEKDTKNQFIISFPIGHWLMEKVDKAKKIVPQKKEEEKFDLDEYLKKNKGKGKMINLNITKVGE